MISLVFAYVQLTAKVHGLRILLFMYITEFWAKLGYGTCPIKSPVRNGSTS